MAEGKSFNKVIIGVNSSSILFYIDNQENFKKLVSVLVDEGIHFRCESANAKIEIFGDKV
jgi:7-cyano-7-deazaguanine synthase in queuosine biosynthesis